MRKINGLKKLEKNMKYNLAMMAENHDDIMGMMLGKTKPDDQ